jgi:hypothetical protein
MFIKKVNYTSSLSIIKQDLNTVLTLASWEPMNQIGLNHRANATNTWLDAAGSLYDRSNKVQLGNELDFNIWNSECPSYVMNEIKNLVDHEKFKLGRVRFMRLKPKTGLSVHNDAEFRYHFVVETNQYSYISHKHFKQSRLAELPIQTVSYHIPADGNWYLVDTTQIHYVYNGGDTDRIHLVICAIKD